MNELIEVQQKYIKYLELHISRMVGISNVHGQQISHDEYLEGVNLREEIKRLTK